MLLKYNWTRRSKIVQLAAAILFAAVSIFIILQLIKYIIVSYDVLIINAVIHTGIKDACPFLGTAAIKGEYIKKIWKGRPGLIMPKAKQTIDACGLDLTPGFIDAHSHANEGICNRSGHIRADNFVSQGITTVVAGNCGRSPIDIGAYGRSINSRGSNINIASFIGFNSIRDKVMPDINRPADEFQIKKMCDLAKHGMKDGALGISTGLAYPPGNYASRDELAALLKIAQKYGGIHATHMRNEGKDILHALNEVIEISQYANIPLLVSHFKITGPKNCGQYDKLLNIIYTAKSKGMQIYVDQYPYDASSTNLNIFLPDWYLAMNSKSKLKILRSSIERNKLKNDIRDIIISEGLKNLEIATISFFPQHFEWQGKTLDQIAHLNGKLPPLSLNNCIDIILEIESFGGAEIIYHSTCQDVMDRIPIDFDNLVSTDSSVRCGEGARMPVPHPRGWGSFPRFIKYFVNEKKCISLDEAIYRMTGLPANVFGLNKRGAIKKGYFADIVLFNSQKIADKATYEHPFLPPVGIIYVLINGKVIVDNEQYTDNKSKFMKPGVLNIYPGKYIKREKPN